MKTLAAAIVIIMAVSVGLIHILNQKDITIMDQKYYKGAMPGGYNFEMTLKRSGNNLTGSVLNTYSDITLVRGLLDENGNFILREYEHEKITGIYKGKFYPKGVIKGVWSNPDGTRRVPFNMIQEVKTPPVRASHFSIGSLNPKNLIPLLKGE